MFMVGSMSSITTSALAHVGGIVELPEGERDRIFAVYLKGLLRDFSGSRKPIYPACWLVDHCQQHQNTKLYKSNTSGWKGEFLTTNGRYAVSIQAYGDRKHLGVLAPLPRRVASSGLRKAAAW
jgi:hypothetical protein